MANKTIDKIYGPAINITDQKEADIYFEMLISGAMIANPNLSHEEAEDQECHNLGMYAAVHCSIEVEKRIGQLFLRDVIKSW